VPVDQLTVEFDAVVIPRLKQGDHDVILMTYQELGREPKRLSIVVVPDRITPALLALFDRNHTESHTPRTR
jgi:hypothetical protein